jgi:zinc transport system substrate-binding protein
MTRRAFAAALALLFVLTMTCARQVGAAPPDAASAPATSAQPRLRVGVTLHPYYSWTRNVVGDTPVDVVPILPGEIDAGDYQPRPEDIAKIADLDAIVINGLGHDDFITDMIKASGNAKIVVIRPNEGTPLLKAAHGGSVNSHTFISFSNAIQQTYAIAKALGALRPTLAATFEQNAAQYARRLRAIKASAASRIGDPRRKRVVTVHDGYGYLMQEFGIGIAGVVEPAHGLVPSAKELGDMVDLLNREKIRVVFSEESFPEPLLKVLRDEGHAKVYIISHVASGQYSADKFEIEMQRNADALVEAMNASDGSGP